MPNKKQFAAFIRVQCSGDYNMMDPRAQIITKLSKKTYAEIIAHYEELANLHPEVIANEGVIDGK